MKIEEMNELNIKWILKDYDLVDTYYNINAEEKNNFKNAFVNFLSNIDLYVENYEKRYKRKVINVVLNSQIYTKRRVKEADLFLLVNKKRLFDMYIESIIECNVLIKKDNKEYLFLIQTDDNFELIRLYIINDKFVLDNQIDLNKFYDVSKSLIRNNLPTIKKIKK